MGEIAVSFFAVLGFVFLVFYIFDNLLTDVPDDPAPVYIDMRKTDPRDVNAVFEMISSAKKSKGGAVLFSDLYFICGSEFDPVYKEVYCGILRFGFGDVILTEENRDFHIFI